MGADRAILIQTDDEVEPLGGAKLLAQLCALAACQHHWHYLPRLELLQPRLALEQLATRRQDG